MIDRYTQDTQRTRHTTLDGVCTNPDCPDEGQAFTVPAEDYMGTLYADLECPTCYEYGETT